MPQGYTQGPSKVCFALLSSFQYPLHTTELEVQNSHKPWRLTVSVLCIQRIIAKQTSVETFFGGSTIPEYAFQLDPFGSTFCTRVKNQTVQTRPTLNSFLLDRLHFCNRIINLTGWMGYLTHWKPYSRGSTPQMIKCQKSQCESAIIQFIVQFFPVSIPSMHLHHSRSFVVHGVF